MEIAILEDKPEVARAQLKLINPSDATKLFNLAVDKGYPELAREILYKCPLVDWSTYDHVTAKDYPELIRDLINANVKTTSKILDWSITHHHVELARKIILHPRERLCSQDTVFSGRSLELAIVNIGADFVRFMIAKGCDMTPRSLELAIENNHFDLALEIIEKRLSYNTRVVRPTSIMLNLAIKKLQVELVRELLDAKCPLSEFVLKFANSSHDHPIDKEIVELLRAHMNLNAFTSVVFANTTHTDAI